MSGDGALVIASPLMATPSSTEHLELLTTELLNTVFPYSFRAHFENSSRFVCVSGVHDEETNLWQASIFCPDDERLLHVLRWCLRQLPNGHYELPSLQLVYESHLKS